MIKWDISICVHCPTSPVVIYILRCCVKGTHVHEADFLKDVQNNLNFPKNDETFIDFFEVGMKWIFFLYFN